MVHKNKWLKVLLTSSLVLGSYACTESKTTEEYQAEAVSFIEKNDIKSAIITLKNALTNFPENAEIRFELGNAYLNQGRYKNAEKELEKANQLGVDSNLLIPRLIETKFKLYKYDEVYELTDKARELNDLSYVQALTYAGLSSLYQGNREAAQIYIENANEVSTESVYGQIGKAYLAQTKEDAEDELKVLNNLIAYAPDIADIYLLKGYLLQGSKQYFLAAKAFEEYAILRPGELQVKFFIAQSYISAKDLNKAEIIVNQLLKVAERNPLANQMKAQIEYDRKNYQLARDYGVKAYQQSDKLAAAIIISGMSSYHLRDYEQSYKQLLKVQNKLSPDHIVNNIMVELQLRLGYDEEAIDSIGMLVESKNADNSMLLAASFELLKSGNKSAAQELLNESINLENTNTKELTQQGLLKLQLRDLEEGLDLLERSLALDPKSSQTEAALAAGYLTNNQLQKAFEISNRWKNQNDKNLQGLLLESAIFEKQGNSEQAKASLKKVLSSRPKNITALYQLSVYALKDKSYDESYDYLTKVLSQQPEHGRAVRNFISLVKQEPRFFDKGEKFYLELIKNSVEDHSLQLGLAYIYSNQDKNDDALKIIKSIQNSESPIKGIELVIGDIYLKQGKLTEAIKNYQQFLSSNPSNLNGIGKLTTAYDRKNDVKSALATVDTGLLSFPYNIGLKLLKVNYESRLNKKIDKKLFRELNNDEQAAKHFLFQSALGNIAFANNDMKEATTYFKQSYKLSPTDITVIQLSRAISRAESINSAIDVLKNHLTLRENNAPKVQVVLANAYIQKKDYLMANLVYKDLLERGASNPLVLNNMAYINIKLNNKDEALDFASQAIKYAPNSEDVIDTYGQALLLQGNYQSALEQFEKAISINPKAEFKINKVKTLIKLNRNKEAKVILERVKNVSEEQKLVIIQIQSEL